MNLLDKAEGAGAGYNRTLINVDGFGDCVIYLAAPEHIDDRLLPFSWYKDLVLVGCDRFDFPENYVETIRAVGQKRDLACDRHNRHIELVEKCRQDTSRNSS